jgi:hypothetical protein
MKRQTDARPNWAQFSGYQSPNYTNVPDQLLDEHLAFLSGAELKVILYIIRRTFGFKKDADTISLSQMLTGIVTREGQRLDYGVGLSKKTLLQALRDLQQKHLIHAQQQRSRERGNEPTRYSLNLHSDPLGVKSQFPLEEKLHQGGGGVTAPSPWGNKSPTQETALQETDHNLRISNINASESAAQDARAVSNVHPPLEQSLGQKTSPSLRTTRQSRRREGVTDVGRILLAAHPELVYDPRSDPKQRTISPQLAACVTDISHCFGDAHHLRSNLTRAIRLQNQQQLLEAVFVAKLYEARAITRDRQVSQRGGPSKPISKPMAYFWQVVEDVLGTRHITPDVVPDIAGAATRQGRRPRWSDGQEDG